MASAHDEQRPDGAAGWTASALRMTRNVEAWMGGAAASGEPPDEARLLQERRADMQLPAADRFDALALSGGGIRSATFSLGVLQALAETARDRMEAGPPRRPDSFKDSMLARFDYLSTVSGGGFIGAFLVGLFVPGRLRQAGQPVEDDAELAANRAQAVLGSGPPERIRSATMGAEKSLLRAPLAWLRENGRYLTPTGSGDYVYAAGMGLRNWVSLHVVIGVALLLVLTLMAALRGALVGQPWSGPLDGLEGLLLDKALQGVDALGAAAAAACTSKCPAPSVASAVWWSSLFPLALVPLLLWVLPTGIAFWTTSRRRDGVSLPVNRSMLGMTLAAAVFAGMAWCRAGESRGLHGVWLGLSALTLLGVLVHVVLALFEPGARKQAVLLTRWLGAGLVATGVLVLLGVVETLGHTLYLLTIRTEHGAWLPTVPAALGAALAWVAKKIGASGSASGLPGWLQQLPLTTLGGFLGLAVLLLIATVWAWVVQWLTWQGARPSLAVMGSTPHLQLLLAQAAAWLLLAVGVGQFPAFINLSSLQSFYAARLIRTYLGASNGERFDGDARHLSAAEPLPGDNLPLEQLWAGGKLKTWAPLHLVNVTLNKTIDPAEQLVQRDRKGQPMAVMPYGFSIDGWRNLFKPHGGNFPLNPTMHLGDWVGTSGAAFSTGIGRETTLGMSLLMGAANVRLGVWWASGVHEQKAPAWWKLPAWIGRGLGAVFRTQTYLGYEFTARFYGLRRRWQYLSDGGHFENTALYELLRRERNVGFILASDNGADPDYRFDDLANLIRLARIDLRTEVSVISDFRGWPLLPEVFGTTTQFSADGSKPNRAALLLRAQALPGDDGMSPPPCWIVLLKPSKQAGAPADVLQYAKTHPAFPQEPTSDQFFDEAQWESYRSLGQHIAGRVLAPAVWAELEKFMAGEPAPVVSSPS